MQYLILSCRFLDVPHTGNKKEAFDGWLAGKPLLAMAGELLDLEQPVAPTYPDALSAPTSALFTYTISTLII